MAEAVIVATARSSIGRARKGFLVSLRPDDLAAQVTRAVLDKIPSVSEITDLHLGCAEPQDEHDQNIARRIAGQLGHDTLPGTTVNRFCASSVQTARMAFHAIKAGEGHAFVSADVECVSRCMHSGAPAFTPLFDEAQQRTLDTAASNAPWTDPRRDGKLPDYHIAMGRTAENVATQPGISRYDRDEFGMRARDAQGMAIILERLS